MTQNQKYPLESRTEAVSRDALVQAALQEITQNYREASLSNVARAYGVSLAYVSECVRAETGRRPARPTRSCCRGTAWRRRPACCAAAI